ncbi:MAG TPA: DNRLRE domain-containing protein [Verrucomicrobiae bacterium]
MQRALAILAALFAATTLHAATITILCSADTGISSAFPSANMGGKTQIPIGRSAVGGYKSRGLYRFDLTNIPPNATIVRATLNIPVTFLPSNDVPALYELHRMYLTWTEGNKVGGDYGATADPGEATWLMRTTQRWMAPGAHPGFGFGTGDYLSLGSGGATVSSNGIASFSSDIVAGDVIRFRNDPIENHGWIIHETSEATNRTEKLFATREHPTNPPTLVVTYTTPGEPPQITAIYKDGTNIIIAWIGGMSSYQIQSADNPNGPWTNLGPITTQTSALLPISSSHQFFRILGHPSLKRLPRLQNS